MDHDGDDDEDSEHRRRGEDAEEDAKPAEPAGLDREKVSRRTSVIVILMSALTHRDMLW